jgi:phosphoribosylanthranilate isomerase
MTWVKICGMTNLEDALVAVDAGADAVGFVFYEKSPRCVSVDTVREIVRQLPDRVETVGVFAGESILHSVDTGHQAGLDALQVYIATYRESPKDGDLQGKAAGSIGLKTYLALPMEVFLGTGSRDLTGFRLDRPAGVFDTLFLDSGSSAEPGGTGRKFNWHEAKNAVDDLSTHQHVVIAGGLNPQNVREAIDILHPWGVDVASGVEARPGKKDPEKVRALVRAVREVDGKAS